MDSDKQLEAIRDVVRDSIIDDFVRELLAGLRGEAEENREWATSVEEWLVGEIWGDPDASS